MSGTDSEVNSVFLLSFKKLYVKDLPRYLVNRRHFIGLYLGNLVYIFM